MPELKGLDPFCTVLDIEKFCRVNWENFKDRQTTITSHLDYSEGVRDVLKELIDTFFRGTE